MIELLIAVIILALILWLISSIIPLDARFKTVLTVIVVVAFIIYLLRYAKIF